MSKYRTVKQVSGAYKYTHLLEFIYIVQKKKLLWWFDESYFETFEDAEKYIEGAYKYIEFAINPKIFPYVPKV